MAEESKKELSKAEWKVMKIVWEVKKGVAREIYTIAGQEYSWSPATVKTLLKRLVDKKFVKTAPVGNGFVYRPAKTAISALRNAADHLLTQAIAGTTGPLLAHMVKRTDLSLGEIKELERLIEVKKKQAKKNSSK